MKIWWAAVIQAGGNTMQFIAKNLRSFLAMGTMAICATVVPVRAQTSGGAVSVTVIDPSGAAVPQLVVEIQNTQTNDTPTVVTPESDGFALRDLPLGAYP